MKTIDRLIFGTLAVGVWALIAIQVTTHTPAYAARIDASDVNGLRGFVERVVRNCSVKGQVYMSDKENGRLQNASISC